MKKFLFPLLAAMLLADGMNGQVVHTRAVPYSPAPPLPFAGSKAETAYGTDVLRLTDETDGTACYHGYAYWQPLSRDNRYAVVMCTGVASGPRLITLDPAKRTRVASTLLPAIPGKGVPNVETATWSSLVATRLYVPFGAAIYTFDPVTLSYTLVKDLSSKCSLGLRQWSISDDEQTFAGHCRTATGTSPLVWRRSSDQVLYTEAESVFDEAQLSGNGRYLVVKPSTRTVPVRVIDLYTKAVTTVDYAATQCAPGHSDMGLDTLAAYCDANGYVTGRNLANPRVYSYLTNNAWWDVKGSHVSMRNRSNLDWALVSSNHNDTEVAAGKPFTSELFYVAMDGSRRVWRMGIHYRGDGVYAPLTAASYWTIPRAVASWDASAVLITSQWGVKGGRPDVYVYFGVAPGH